MSKWFWNSEKEEQVKKVEAEKSGNMEDIGPFQLNIHLQRPDQTVSNIIDLAHKIGHGQPVGSGPAIMATFLRDMAKPWTDAMCDSVRKDYEIPNTVAAITRTFGLLLASTLIASCHRGKEYEGIDALLHLMRDDMRDQVAGYLGQKAPPPDLGKAFDKLMEEFNARRTKERMERRAKNPAD